MNIPTTYIRMLCAAPTAVRDWAARFDLLASAGSRYAWYRLSAAHQLKEHDQLVRDSVYRRIWEEGAEWIGASCADLGGGVLEIRREQDTIRLWRQELPIEDPSAVRLALDKPRVHRLLREAGVPVPEHAEFEARDLAPALDFLHDVDGPCVVKPATNTGGGSGVTAQVRTERQLARAALLASRGGSRLLIERQLGGNMYRALLLDGHLLDVYYRKHPTVVGNGVLTVLQLMEQENARRQVAFGEEGIQLLTPSLDCVFTLAEAGLTLRSVVPDGVEVELKTVSNQSGIRNSHRYMGQLASTIAEHVQMAASVVGLRLAGVDFVTEDPTRPLHQTGGAILEVNGNPALHHHYQVANPTQQVPVAAVILRKLLS